MANIEEKVENLISKTIETLGYELYDVLYEKESQDYYLRIFIDTPQGISLDDCEKVNDAITDMLDEADYIKDQYFLEVSSPGVERVLRKEKHFEANLGEEITCHLFHPITMESNKDKHEENKQQAREDNQLLKSDREEQTAKAKKKQSKDKTQKQVSFKQINGVLQSFDKDKIVLQVEMANQNEPVELEIDRKNIAMAKLKYNW